MTRVTLACTAGLLFKEIVSKNKYDWLNLHRRNSRLRALSHDARQPWQSKDQLSLIADTAPAQQPRYPQQDSLDNSSTVLDHSCQPLFQVFASGQICGRDKPLNTTSQFRISGWLSLHRQPNNPRNPSLLQEIPAAKLYNKKTTKPNKNKPFKIITLPLI